MEGSFKEWFLYLSDIQTLDLEYLRVTKRSRRNEKKDGIMFSHHTVVLFLCILTAYIHTYALITADLSVQPYPHFINGFCILVHRWTHTLCTCMHNCGAWLRPSRTQPCVHTLERKQGRVMQSDTQCTHSIRHPDSSPCVMRVKRWGGWDGMSWI